MNNETLVNTTETSGSTPVTSITVTAPICGCMVVGDSVFFKATVAPSNASNCSVRWSSSDTSVATVNPESGLVMAQSKGCAIIYASACDGSGKSDSFNLTVNDPVLVESITLNYDSLVLFAGDKQPISATVYPEICPPPSICWHSTDTSVATVDACGCVTAVNGGYAYIYATAQDGSCVSACCSVIVKLPILKAKKRCYVRKDMMIDPSTILKDADGNDVILEVDDTVPLLSAITTCNCGREWYRILYNGMMMHVTADDCSFEITDSFDSETPGGTPVIVNSGTVDLNVRCTPSTDYEPLGQFANGSTVTLTNESPQNGIWYAVYGLMSNGKFSYGWCSGEYLEHYDNNNDNMGGSILTPIASNEPLTQSQMENNAKIIYDYLTNKVPTPWSKAATCAVLGNMQVESWINPGKWQNGEGSAYGLVQWDFARDALFEYLRNNGYSDDDLFGQLEYLILQCESGSDYWNTSSFPSDLNFISFNTFRSSNAYSVEDLTRVFLWAFEKPSVPHEERRIANALNWYNFFSE